MRKAILVAALVLATLSVGAQAPNHPPLVPGLPQSFHWRNNPASWNVLDGVLSIQAAAKTNWYIAPTGDAPVASSPVLLFPAGEDFWFSAKVTVDFRSQWDAGALTVYADEENWIKFAFENSVEKVPSIVSVVTRGTSDDCTAAALEGKSVYLEVSKTGRAIFLFYSADGKKWQLTRALNLETDKPLQFGFSSQSPAGEGTAVTFSKIRYKAEGLKPWLAN